MYQHSQNALSKLRHKMNTYNGLLLLPFYISISLENAAVWNQNFGQNTLAYLNIFISLKVKGLEIDWRFRPLLRKNAKWQNLLALTVVVSIFQV